MEGLNFFFPFKVSCSVLYIFTMSYFVGIDCAKIYREVRGLLNNLIFVKDQKWYIKETFI